MYRFWGSYQNAPLICIRKDDGDFIDMLLEKARDSFEVFKIQKSTCLETNIVKAIYDLNIGGNKNPLFKKIAEDVSSHNKSYEPSTIGKIVRSKLGLDVKRGNAGWCVIYNEGSLNRLMKEYYIDLEKCSEETINDDIPF